MGTCYEQSGRQCYHYRHYNDPVLAAGGTMERQAAGEL